MSATPRDAESSSATEATMHTQHISIDGEACLVRLHPEDSKVMELWAEQFATQQATLEQLLATKGQAQMEAIEVQKLHRLAAAKLRKVDPIDGLLRHGAFRERCRRELRKASQSHERCVLMLLDIDNTASINRDHGYELCDKLLHGAFKLVAREMNMHAKRPATIGREYSDALGILLCNVSDESAFSLAEVARATIESAPLEIRVTATVAALVGIPQEAEDLDRRFLQLSVMRRANPANTANIGRIEDVL